MQFVIINLRQFRQRGKATFESRQVELSAQEKLKKFFARKNWQEEKKARSTTTAFFNIYSFHVTHTFKTKVVASHPPRSRPQIDDGHIKK